MKLKNKTPFVFPTLLKGIIIVIVVLILIVLSFMFSAWIITILSNPILIYYGFKPMTFTIGLYIVGLIFVFRLMFWETNKN